jgi:hypothetical protein
LQRMGVAQKIISKGRSAPLPQVKLIQEFVLMLMFQMGLNKELFLRSSLKNGYKYYVCK